MGNIEIFKIALEVFNTIAIFGSLLYLGLQFKRSAKIHEQNLEWQKRIETRKKLDDYNRLDSAQFLNEHLKFISRKHPIPVDEINDCIKTSHEIVVHLSRLLNYYEAIAIGIENNIYNEELVKVTRKNAMISTFTSFEDYIKYDRREDNPSAYIKFENLIKQWIGEDRKTQGLPLLGKI